MTTQYHYYDGHVNNVLLFKTILNINATVAYFLLIRLENRRFNQYSSEQDGTLKYRFRTERQSLVRNSP